MSMALARLGSARFFIIAIGIYKCLQINNLKCVGQFFTTSKLVSQTMYIKTFESLFMKDFYQY